jgi:hypothetical protein
LAGILPAFDGTGTTLGVRIQENVMVRWVQAATSVALVAASPAFAAPAPSIPNFTADSRTGWIKTPGSDEFVQPASGPGPVQDDPNHPYVSNGHPGDAEKPRWP